MSFNPDPSKQAQEIAFGRKELNLYIRFNNNNMFQTSSQKPLDVVLDERLTFEDNFKMILSEKKMMKC